MEYVGIALLGVLGVILLLLAVAVVRTLTLPHKTAGYQMSQDEARKALYAEKLSKMVQVETVSVKGKAEPEKFRKMHDRMEELFPTVFSTCEKIEIDGNLMMKWKGRTDKEPLLLMSHIDVVEATGEWKHPPFSGDIADGKVWGRGAADTKGSVMCFYQAAEELIQAGYVPECDVYLSSSCTEEVGGDGAPKLVNWLKAHGVHLYMLCDEGGAIVQDPIGGVKGNFAAIGLFEKGHGNVRFIARSNGGHSSAPGKNTPIPRLAKFVARVEKKTPFKVEFSPAVEGMFAQLAPYAQNFGLRLVMHNLWLFKPILKKVMPAISPQAAAMLQTTIAFTMQSGSAGFNVLPQEASVVGNLRYIPHQGMEESVAVISALAREYGLEAQDLGGNGPSKELDLEGEAYKLFARTVASVFPEVGIMPYVVIGGTDARFYGDVCDNCIRFAPLCFGPEQMAGMHGLNECVEIGCLPGGVDCYKAIIKAQEERSA